MSYANLRYEVEDSIAQVTVNRPEKLNPLNAETVAALGQCFDDIAADDSVKAVIVTGAGEKAFVAGADINPLTRERFQARYEAKAYASIEELCEDPEVEAVWISTPNRFHAPMTIYALEHGKHVVVEKPMALNLEEAQAMCDTAKRTGTRLSDFIISPSGAELPFALSQ